MGWQKSNYLLSFFIKFAIFIMSSQSHVLQFMLKNAAKMNLLYPVNPISSVGTQIGRGNEISIQYRQLDTYRGATLLFNLIYI